MRRKAARSFKDIINHGAAWLNHSLKARSTRGYGIHSPFLFHLVTDIIGNPHAYYAYTRLERIREKLAQLKEPVDCGKKGTAIKSHKVPIGRMVRRIAVPRRQAQLIFRLVNFFQPQYALELGSGTGITSAYIGCAMLKGKAVSIEGNDEIARIASKVLQMADIENVVVRTQNFADAIAKWKQEQLPVDFLFIDGDHAYSKTMQYFRELFPLMHAGSIAVIHDIHWSIGMEKAWYEIAMQHSDTIAIDLFHLGILLFKSGIPDHYLRLRL